MLFSTAHKMSFLSRLFKYGVLNLIPGMLKLLWFAIMPEFKAFVLTSVPLTSKTLKPINPLTAKILLFGLMHLIISGSLKLTISSVPSTSLPVKVKIWPFLIFTSPFLNVLTLISGPLVSIIIGSGMFNSCLMRLTFSKIPFMPSSVAWLKLILTTLRPASASSFNVW